MPGGRLRTFRLGDRSELLVQHLLAGIAFTTPVPRQEDIGLDFLCSLITGYGRTNLLTAGPFFSVQAKSDTKALEYKEPHQIEWIRNQENPLLLCVADREAGAMDVYSTWNLLCAVMNGWKGKQIPNCIRLRPGESHSWDWRGVEDQEDGSQDVLLGKPIIRITHQQIFDDSSVGQIAQILGDWIKLDRENIVNCRAGLNWVIGPVSYESGVSPWQNVAASFYWNPRNLPKCSENLVRAAVAVWRILRDPNIANQVPTGPWSDGLVPLEELLRWVLKQQPALRQFLPDLETDLPR
jgi:hypothetical protein